MNILNPQSGGAVKSSVLIVMCVKLNTRCECEGGKSVPVFMWYRSLQTFYSHCSGRAVRPTRRKPERVMGCVLALGANLPQMRFMTNPLQEASQYAR